MKKILITMAVIFLLLFASQSHASNYFLWASCRTGGGACLDGINGSDIKGDGTNIALQAGDACVVIMDLGSTTPSVYIYRVYASSAAESDPDVITPDTNPGTLRWHLVNVYGKSFTTIKLTGIAGTETLWSDYLLEEFGVSWKGPHATSARGATLYLQFPNPDPADNQFMLFPAPTTGTATAAWVTYGTPPSADGLALGTTALEWSDLYLADGGRIYFQNDQSVYLTPSAATLTLTGTMAATGFSGPLTGNVTGNASGSAATLTGTLANVAASTSANLATCLSDEQGTGVAIFSDSPVFVDDITVAAAGVKLTGANGALTILGLGDGADEDVKIDLNTTANTIIVSSPASSATTVSLSALNLVTTGTIEGGIKVTKDDDTLAADQCYGVAHWYSGGAETITLPAAVVGMNLGIYASDASVKHVDPNGTDTIVLNGTALAAGYQIESPGAAGDYITLICFTANQWTTWGRSGTWITHGAD